MLGRVCQVAERGVLGGSDEDQGSHVIWNQGLAGELPNRIQNGRAKGLSAAGRIGLQTFFDAVEAEFQVFRFVIFALAFNDSARNQQNRCAFLQTYRGSVGGGVGKKSERQARGYELGNACAVAEKSRGVPGVGIAQRAKPLVVATDERRARVNPRGGFHQAAVEAKAKRGHGFRFVDIGPRKELGSESAKDLLRGRKNELIASRGVRQRRAGQTRSVPG